MEDGVWRTIGGRRVFIKTGQTLSEAMKESGKFKTNKNNSDKYIILSDKEFDRMSKECQEQLNEEDIKYANDYYVHKLGCNAINKQVEKYGDDYIEHASEIGEEHTKTIEAMDRLTTEYEIDKDIVTHRFVFNNYIENVYGKEITDVDFNKIDTNKYHSFEEIFAERLNEKFVGTEVEAKRFLSSSTSIDKNLTKQVTNVMLKINVGKGNTGYFTGNSSESELILPRKTKLKMEKAYIQKIDGWERLIIEYEARTK